MTTPLAATLLPLLLLLAPAPAVESIDAAYHPRLSLILAPVPADLDPDTIALTEDGRPIRTRRVTAVDGRPGALRVTFLSATRRTGRHAVAVSWPGGNAATGYESGRTRGLGPNRLRNLHLRVHGPDGTSVTCRVVARNEDTGRIVEDLTTPGGYGSLATGMGLDEGAWTAELSLPSLDLPLTTVAFRMDADRTTDVDVTLSALALPVTPLPAPSDALHLELTREGSPAPLLALNLALLPATLPLLPGSYTVTLRPARSDVHPPRLPWTTRLVLPPGRTVPLPLPW